MTGLEPGEPLRFAQDAMEAVLIGGQTLRRAFLTGPIFSANRGDKLAAGNGEPKVLLIRSGVAYRASALADGSRAILDILIPGELIGLSHIVARPSDEFTAACRLRYNALSCVDMRRLMSDQAVALHIFSLLADARWRSSRLAMSIGRLDAQGRICAMLLDIYERLRRRDLIGRPTFNLPLTQDQIADHLGLTVVHVNRTLRRLREERVLILDRQVVIILDLDRLRALARGLSYEIGLPEPASPSDSFSLSG